MKLACAALGFCMFWGGCTDTSPIAATSDCMQGWTFEVVIMSPRTTLSGTIDVDHAVMEYWEAAEREGRFVLSEYRNIQLTLSPHVFGEERQEPLGSHFEVDVILRRLNRDCNHGWADGHGPPND